MKILVCLLFVYIGVVSGLELEAELAYVNHAVLHAEESHLVMVRLDLSHTLNRYLELEGRYAFGSLGIAARTGFDLKPFGLRYSLSLNVDGWVYLQTNDNGVEETRPGLWLGDYLELRLGHERYNLYVGYPLGSAVINNTTPGWVEMWFGRVLEVEAGVQVSRVRVGARGLAQWDTHREVSSARDDTAFEFRGYLYGFVDFQFRKGILERARIGFWPSTGYVSGLCLSVGVELKLDGKREAEPTQE
ncbi:MAG: hypothetical protein GF331_22675 [Chitinivibrionales bacterium]|nr:hypothetical protein [Chitinivibrionales bacterium]